MNRKSKALIVLLTVLMAFTSIAAPVSAAEAYSQDAEIALTGVLKPEFTSVGPAQGGIGLSWAKVDSVNLYRLDRYYDDGRGWVTLAKTSDLSYVDTGVASGYSYRYRLLGVNSAGTEVTSSVTVTYTYTAPPEITSAEMTPLPPAEYLPTPYALSTPTVSSCTIITMRRA